MRTCDLTYAVKEGLARPGQDYSCWNTGEGAVYMKFGQPKTFLECADDKKV